MLSLYSSELLVTTNFFFFLLEMEIPDGYLELEPKVLNSSSK